MIKFVFSDIPVSNSFKLDHFVNSRIADMKLSISSDKDYDFVLNVAENVQNYFPKLRNLEIKFEYYGRKSIFDAVSEFFIHFKDFF